MHSSDQKKKYVVPCEKHDYLETACVFRMRLELHLLAGEVIQGVAQDLVSHQGKESLILRGPHQRSVFPLDEIRLIRALTPNKYFKELCLRSNKSG